MSETTKHFRCEKKEKKRKKKRYHDVSDSESHRAAVESKNKFSEEREDSKVCLHAIDDNMLSLKIKYI
jgi:hypothetical protein